MSNADRDIRVLASVAVEKREAEAGKPVVLVGYAAVFGEEADIAGIFREKILRGAFAEAIRNDDVHALRDHDYRLVLGRAKAGTLKLSEDDHGLRVEIELPDTQTARDLLVSLDRGDVDQMSFSFGMKGGKEDWDDTGDIPVRTITKIGTLWEVSIVPRGAYSTTEIGRRSLEAHRKEAKRHNFNAAAKRLAMKAQIDQRERGI